MHNVDCFPFSYKCTILYSRVSAVANTSYASREAKVGQSSTKTLNQSINQLINQSITLNGPMYCESDLVVGKVVVNPFLLRNTEFPIPKSTARRFLLAYTFFRERGETAFMHTGGQPVVWDSY